MEGGMNMKPKQVCRWYSIGYRSREKSQELLHRVVRGCKEQRMKLNEKKTCCMVIEVYYQSRKWRNWASWKFKYHHSVAMIDYKCKWEIFYTIGMTKSMFKKNGKYPLQLCNSILRLDVRVDQKPKRTEVAQIRLLKSEVSTQARIAMNWY